jgi:ketosteroid isomerase-like protein
MPPRLDLDPPVCSDDAAAVLNIHADDVLLLAIMLLVATALVSIVKRWGARRP